MLIFPPAPSADPSRLATPPSSERVYFRPRHRPATKATLVGPDKLEETKNPKDFNSDIDPPSELEDMNEPEATNGTSETYTSDEQSSKPAKKRKYTSDGRKERDMEKRRPQNVTSQAKYRKKRNVMFELVNFTLLKALPGSLMLQAIDHFVRSARICDQLPPCKATNDLRHSIKVFREGFKGECDTAAAAGQVLAGAAS
jgi:hypothetical protein